MNINKSNKANKASKISVSSVYSKMTIQEYRVIFNLNLSDDKIYHIRQMLVEYLIECENGGWGIEYRRPDGSWNSVPVCAGRYRKEDTGEIANTIKCIMAGEIRVSQETNKAFEEWYSDISRHHKTDKNSFKFGFYSGVQAQRELNKKIKK